MFRGYAGRLTELSNHYIDWSRVGSLAISNHHYTRDEIKQRTSIILFTACSAYLGTFLKHKDTDNSFFLALTTGLIGFTIAHALIILPLIQKRHEFKQACMHLADEILSMACHLDESQSNQINKQIATILATSLHDDTHGRASQTWGIRKRLLTELRDDIMSQKSTQRKML